MYFFKTENKNSEKESNKTLELQIAEQLMEFDKKALNILDFIGFNQFNY